jgi:CubicO group peptidase (beta-lactamase class C family)
LPFSRSRAFLEKALAEKQASGIAFLLRRPDHSDTEFYLGSHAHEGTSALMRPVAEDSLFDLASVSKILATVCLLFGAESEGKFAWTDPVRKYFSDFPSPDATILSLLAHRSGLPAHIDFFGRFAPLAEGGTRLGDPLPLLSWICEAGVPNAGKQVYSDLGFLLLGLFLESLYGKSLPELFYERIVSRLKIENAGYVTLPHAPAPARIFGLLAPVSRFVATETCPWRKKTLQGEVHDDNAWALGGYGGHAGIFSNARDAATLWEHLRRQVSASPEFLRMLPEGPGTFCFGLMTYPGLRPFPGNAFAGARGHTGFTGTSLWFHESSGSLAILLSNRVHPSRADDRFIQTRLEFHSLVWEELGL